MARQLTVELSGSQMQYATITEQPSWLGRLLGQGPRRSLAYREDPRTYHGLHVRRWVTTKRELPEYLVQAIEFSDAVVHAEPLPTATLVKERA